MKLNVYSIYDSAATAYTQPFFMHNDGLAVRAFQGNVNTTDSNINLNPDQFTLFQIGTYDDNSGELISITPKSLGNGLQYKEKTDKLSDFAVQIDDIQNMLEKLLEKK